MQSMMSDLNVYKLALSWKQSSSTKYTIAMYEKGGFPSCSVLFTERVTYLNFNWLEYLSFDRISGCYELVLFLDILASRHVEARSKVHIIRLTTCKHHLRITQFTDVFPLSSDRR